MLDTLKSWARLALVAVMALLLIGSAAELVVKFGFAWALIFSVVAGWIWARRFDVGIHGERAWLVPIVFIIVAIGLAVGLLLQRTVLT